jgi:hypothetical protein
VALARIIIFNRTRNPVGDYLMKKMIKKEIEDAIVPFGAILLEFSYSKAFFGNIIIKIIDCNNKIHTYILDRGDIYNESHLLCSHDDYISQDKNCLLNKLIYCITQDLKHNDGKV